MNTSRSHKVKLFFTELWYKVELKLYISKSELIILVQTLELKCFLKIR